MATKRDRSVGIVPVYTDADGARYFCLVHHAKGHWAFPKGHQDEGESAEISARRELYEETGIITCKIDSAHTFTERYTFEKDGAHYDKEVMYFIGLLAEKRAVAPIEAFKGEILEARWVSYYEAKELISFPESIKILDEVLAYLNTKR